ncbi:serine hydrolase domain-containing protein [Kutzneria sp. CA-103260]|uniref:serine hydrolase domain-containing protein n=1 Tax=Kutzneria sp. CA-103260 TaxID=2802641 RepID=UPI001BAD5A3A|nr:serine hydrolase domain-containing protein [Kutzneria sp. CA-103260]QUQ68790.1 esterase [Kutzneria sp. CA-103260]
MDVYGEVAPGFEAVRDAFAKAQAPDPGSAQLAVHRNGRPVVDLWTGPESFTGDSISVLMSVSKGLTASCAHLLAQRGLLDYDRPVRDYWPEFGKPEITVRHLLSHTAGLPAFPPEIGYVELLNWDLCVGALAAMTPMWRPGTELEYHAVTYGFLVGEVIRRISGRSVGTFLREEFAEPLGLDLWIGLPASELDRFVNEFTTLPNPDPAVEVLNNPAVLAAELPAANGVGNARSLARFYGALIDSLFTEKTLDRATVVQTDGLPSHGEPGEFPVRFALGYEAPRAGSPLLGGSSFGHAGLGGRLAFADRASGLSVGYTCTNMSWEPETGPDPRWTPWLSALRDASRRAA